MRITEVKTVLTKGLAAKMLVVLALGIILVRATGLSFETTPTDGPSRPLVTKKTVSHLIDDNMPGDARMVHSPFYEDFPEGSR